MTTLLETLLAEKNISLDQGLEIKGNFGLTVENVLELIYNAPEDIQRNIIRTFMKIDFENGDVMHYINYLGKGMVNGF